MHRTAWILSAHALLFACVHCASVGFLTEAGIAQRAARTGQKSAQLTEKVDDSEAFEFDLDIPSKQQLKRLHSQLDDDDTCGVFGCGDDEDADGAWSSIPDLTNKVKASGFNYGRGVGYVTTQEVLKGDVLFSIPATEVINLRSAREGRIRALLDANPKLPSSIAIALYLLEVRFLGPKSRFHTYIESLPSNVAINSTVFYSDEELESLRGSHLHRTTIGRLQGLWNFYDVLLEPVTSVALDPPLFTKDQFTKANFAWAMGTVWARAFAITDAEEDVVVAPILDTIGACLDEDCPKNRVEWDPEHERLVVYATQSYTAGEEVLLELGSSKPSTLLMLNNGFARPNAYANAETLSISIALDPNDTLVAVKAHVLASYNMSIHDNYVLRHGSEGLNPVMVKSLKLKLMSAAELDKYHFLLSPESTGLDGQSVISLRNEFVFTRAIVITCKSLLDQYPSSLENDRHQLRQLESHYRDRRAGVADRTLQILRAIVTEKEILHHTMQLAKQRWNDVLVSGDPLILGK